MRPAASRSLAGLAATSLVTLVVVCALAGGSVLAHPGRAVIGRNPSNDFQIMAWSLRYWPWAATHESAPWNTQLLWYPSGFSTIWLTSIPGPALLALPITLAAGAIVSYNLLVVAALVAAAAAAYLLCWEVTRHAGAACVGGLLFGLSPYLLGHMLSEHLDLVMVFPLPLIALAVVRRARGAMRGRSFVASVAVLLAFLAASSLELFVDTTLLLAIAGLLIWPFDPSRRSMLVDVGLRLGAAYVLCAPLLAGAALLALSTAHGQVQHPPADFSTDLLNLVVPTPTLLVGSPASLARLSAQFVGNVGERDGYLGIPLLVVCALAVRKDGRRLLPALVVLVVAVALSLGPIVAVAGRPLVRLPLSTADLPVLRDALPARMAVFAALAASVLAAAWLARLRGRLAAPAAVALLAVSVLPNFRPPPRLQGAWAVSSEFAWSTPSVAAGPVGGARWRALVGADPNVLVLPTQDRTESQWWQAESGFRFALAVPETPFVPPSLAADPTVARLVDDALPQLDGRLVGAARLRAFLRARAVTAVVVTPRGRRRWLDIVREATATRPALLGGSLVFPFRRSVRPLGATRGVFVQTLGRPRRAAGRPLRLSLRFDGTRGRLVLRTGSGATMLLSSRSSDVESVAAARRGRAVAIAFVSWDGRRNTVEVATDAGSHWRVARLDRVSAPVWSPRAAITPAGAAVVGWVDQVGLERSIRVASRRPGAAWRAPTQLDRADGVRSFVLREQRSGAVVARWRDSIANESRLLAARYAATGWLGPRVVEEGSE